MRVVTFNANGIRSALSKAFVDWIEINQPDVICWQELRARPEDLQPIWQELNYQVFWQTALKPGYAGTAIWTKYPGMVRCEVPLSSIWFDEGRLIQISNSAITLTSVYLPSGSSGEHRQQIKLRLMDELTPWLICWQKDARPHIIAGDLNIAHQQIDIKTWRTNQKSSGFLPVERDWLTRWQQIGWSDTFRVCHGPDLASYSWWSQRAGSRQRDVGWRIDYQWIQSAHQSTIVSAHMPRLPIYSDHAPVVVDYQGLGLACD